MSGSNPDGGGRKRVLVVGRSELDLDDNSVSTSKYSLLTFFPIAIREQFRRNGNIYFLSIGLLMAVGYYSTIFETAISPWTTLGPLALVISISLAQEGAADISRHHSDTKTNNHPCVVLRRSDDLAESGGSRDKLIFQSEDIVVRLKAFSLSGPNSNATASVAFESIKRMNIRAGDLVLLRNRETIPADLILLATSVDGGNAYIETSSIDGETNLKLRVSPQAPRIPTDLESTRKIDTAGEILTLIETLEQATNRITRFSALGYPYGLSALANPENPMDNEDSYVQVVKKPSLLSRGKSILWSMSTLNRRQSRTRALSINFDEADMEYVAVLTSELPNASINTYSGRLTMPPINEGEPSVEVSLGAENVLLRGAVLRNTEWAIGLACFTGRDTKLVQNSFQTPSKFSKLDELINKTVNIILCVMVFFVISLAGLSVRSYKNRFDELWYAGMGVSGDKWPYLPESFDAPTWKTESPNFGQQVFLYITLLNNFVPLSLYMTVEVATWFMMFWLSTDLDMYHEETDTTAVARSTTLTDLGMVKYIFSDKTGTLTQNIMRFKRCSVDGMIFGAPIEKFAPGTEKDQADRESEKGTEKESSKGEETVPLQSFHPLKQLLVGSVAIPKEGQDVLRDSGLQGFAGVEETSEGDAGTVGNSPETKKRLTFNAEMFLRVMSICNTVVVEKDFHDNMVKDDDTKSKKKNKVKKGRTVGLPPLEAVSEIGGFIPHPAPNSMAKENSLPGKVDNQLPEMVIGKSADGAPPGHNYQAESPDEGALVSAASLTYGFELLGRDSSGIRLACASPSLLADKNLVKSLRDGSLSPEALSAVTASPLLATYEAELESSGGTTGVEISLYDTSPRTETWSILAINKFDSDRKRMSVLVRSPPELGSLPMLLCKGADSAMINSEVCKGGEHLMAINDEFDQSQMNFGNNQLWTYSAGEGLETALEKKNRPSSSILTAAAIGTEGSEWEMATMLELQAHLGDFASEGLRTLVLGVRILQEDECESWLQSYQAASTSIIDRNEKLTDAALAIERDIHIVGATAIEDKLQNAVPETIAMLEDAGIKLWVLTGDKRETAIEIGYSSKVLTPKMHLVEVADGPIKIVRTLMAMEFIRLVKYGKLSQYQQSTLDEPSEKSFSLLKRTLENYWQSFWRKFRLLMLNPTMQFAKLKGCISAQCCNTGVTEAQNTQIENLNDDPLVRRKAVRSLAYKVIKDYQASRQGAKDEARQRAHDEAHMEPPVARSQGIQRNNSDEDNLSLSSETIPAVFNRASSARAILDSQRQSGLLTSTVVRALSIASETSKGLSDAYPEIIEEDLLSIASFLPGGSVDVQGTFNKKKRTIFERLFAVDSYVRHGQLGKHVHKEKPLCRADEIQPAQAHYDSARTPRALVIEGAALVHFLGDPLYEEMLFAVASACDAVIACRVSPKQKALLVRMVRKYVQPTPVTLAIGDGANDVGMIQEAHVGIGISGLEGQQAVNASDFSIAQFRFLRELLLIHGRWNFIRQCKVVLFSFYKNAAMAGTLIIFGERCLFSGSPLYDEWVISMFNFVVGWPILFLGLFDRDLDKDYVKRNPLVYASGANNECITFRIILRWVCLTIIHAYTLYQLCGPSLADGGGMTSGYKGLMSNKDIDRPGDGEGGGLLVFGTTIYTSLIFTMAWKVMFECRSIIHGEWPAFTCRKGVGEGWASRLAYTWIGVSWLSIAFYIWAIYMYMLVGRKGASTFSHFVMLTYHVINTRSITWMSVLLASTTACVVDVTGKLFANMYFPTQTQIHMEIQAKENHSTARRRESAHGQLLDSLIT